MSKKENFELLKNILAELDDELRPLRYYLAKRDNGAEVHKTVKDLSYTFPKLLEQIEIAVPNAIGMKINNK